MLWHCGVRLFLILLPVNATALPPKTPAFMEEQPQYIFRHRLPVQLRFSDVDRFGHVNNSVFFSLYDLAKTEYFNAVLADMPRKHGVIPVVANINADFIHPVFFGDSIEVETSVARLGRKSFTVAQQAVNAKTGSIVSTCRTVMVCYSTDKNDSVTIPDEIRSRITEYEANILM